MADEKLKILYLMRILLEETDSAHPLNATQLCERMEQRYEFSCNRKTIYTDIEKLETYGLQIGTAEGRPGGYYIAQREFELPELKLLVDAVQASKFITKERSEELIGKLEKLTSRENARQLQRQVFIYNRIKAGNDAIYDNVDTIHAAIHENRQISFKYCEWTIRKKLVRKKDGADYGVSPWALTWDDENYYLVAYDDRAEKIKHYRVDKMQEIKVKEEKRLGRELFEDFDLPAFAAKTFGMYGGEDHKLTLSCEKNMAGVIIDRFGKDVIMIPCRPADGDKETGRFHVNVTVSVSPQFFGWLAGIGKGIQIISPEDVREEYKRYLKGIIDFYNAEQQL